jgi:hypothetical protein
MMNIAQPCRAVTDAGLGICAGVPKVFQNKMRPGAESAPPQGQRN